MSEANKARAEFGGMGDAERLPPPNVVECLALIDPEGDFVGDHIIAEFEGPRGGLHPIGNIFIRRKSKDVYPRCGGYFADIWLRSP